MHAWMPLSVSPFLFRHTVQLNTQQMLHATIQSRMGLTDEVFLCAFLRMLCKICFAK